MICPDKQALLNAVSTQSDGSFNPEPCLSDPSLLDTSCEPGCTGPKEVHRAFLGRTSILGFDFGFDETCTNQTQLPETAVSL
jgi:hypothetical protein